MRVAICDDNEIDREIIREMLNACFDESTVKPELVLYESGVTLACDIQEGDWFDIVFLDIYMTDHLGIDIAHRLREFGYTGEIVFLTASPDFAIDSYDVTAAGYILKPISPEKLRRAVERVLRNYDDHTYAFRQRSYVVRVPLNGILYVESSNTKCILHCRDGVDYTVYKRLDEIESELNDPRFLRCHQSYLVNMDHVREAGKSFTLDTGEMVLIRQRNLKTIREAYFAYSASKGAAQKAVSPAEDG